MLKPQFVFQQSILSVRLLVFKVGRDVTQCLEEAMAESGLNMRVATLV